MRVLIFGAGAYLPRVEYACLLAGFHILGYLDNAPGKHSQARNGCPIVPPRNLDKFDYELIITSSTSSNDEMREQLIGMGVPAEKILPFSPEGNQWPRNGRYLIHHHHSVDTSSSVLTTEVESFEISGVYAQDTQSQAPADNDALIPRLLSALEAAERSAVSLSAPYQTGENWKNFLRHTRPEYYKARQAGDGEKIGKLLSNFCRNEMSSGILGGKEGFEGYVAHPDMSHGIRCNFNIWAYSIGQAPVAELASPLIGNPYGHLIDGHIVHPNTFLNSYRGHMAKRLLRKIERPVVAEIGGGFGGFGFYVKKHVPNSCYINFDLPENLLVSSYFLSLAYPGLRIHLYTDDENLADLVGTHDIILMPHFALPQLPENSVDLFVNTISLSEMAYPTICEYLKQISRTCRRFFYHENLIENGSGYTFYPVDTFPTLPEFSEISRQPSRWPFFSSTSPHHCHMEQLYIKNC